jgi:hypothetical protein
MVRHFDAHLHPFNEAIESMPARLRGTAPQCLQVDRSIHLPSWASMEDRAPGKHRGEVHRAVSPRLDVGLRGQASASIEWRWIDNAVDQLVVEIRKNRAWSASNARKPIMIEFMASSAEPCVRY